MDNNRNSNAVRLADTPEFVRLNFECFCHRLEQIRHETGFDPAILELPEKEILVYSGVPGWFMDYIPMALKLVSPKQLGEMKNAIAFVAAFHQVHNAAIMRIANDQDETTTEYLRIKQQHASHN